MPRFELVRTLADRAFAEIGIPTAAEVTSRGVVVCGGFPTDLGEAPAVDLPEHAVGLYDPESLDCLFLVHTRHPMVCIAVHPAGRVVAVGGGEYDGGWSWEGSLLVLDLAELRVTSLLAEPREVRDLRWADEDTLEVLVMPEDEDGEPLAMQWLLLPRSSWSEASPHSVRVEDHVVATVALDPDDEETFAFPAPGRRSACDLLDHLAAATGRDRDARGPVRDLEPVGDADMLACSPGVAAERWGSETEPMWRTLAPGTGSQVLALQDERVLSVVQTVDDVAEARCRVALLDTRDGTELALVAEGSPVVASGSAAAGVLLRPTGPEDPPDDELAHDEEEWEDEEWEDEELGDDADDVDDGGDGVEVLAAPLPVLDLDLVDRVVAQVLDGQGRHVGRVRLPEWVSGDDLRPARASRLLAVEGAAPWPWEAAAPLSRVVEVDWRDGPVRLTSPLYSLDPQPARHRLLLESDETGAPPSERVLLCGPAVELDDGLGWHLVQSWSEGRLGPVSAREPVAHGYLARRDHKGGLVWQVALGEDVVGVDEHEGTIAVVGADGTLWTLDARTGTITGAAPLLPVTCAPSAMRFAADGSLWVGLGDGRLLQLRPTLDPDD